MLVLTDTFSAIECRLLLIACLLLLVGVAEVGSCSFVFNGMAHMLSADSICTIPLFTRE